MAVETGLSTLNATSINKKPCIKNASVEKDWRILKGITYQYVFICYYGVFAAMTIEATRNKSCTKNYLQWSIH